MGCQLGSPNSWGLESSRGLFTHLSGACDDLEAGLSGTVVQASAVAWASSQHGGSGLPEQVLWPRGQTCIALYDGHSLRSHIALLLLLSVERSSHKPPKIQEERTRIPTSQWEESQGMCSHVSKPPQPEMKVKLLGNVY